MRKKGILRFIVEIFFSHITGNFSGETFVASVVFEYRKTFCIRGGLTIFYRKLFVSQYRINSKEKPSVFQKNSVVEISYGEEKGREGMSRISLEKFSLTIPKSFVGESFCISEIFWYPRKTINKRGAREYHAFPLKNFCLRVPKILAGEPFGVSEKFCCRKILWVGGEGREGVSRFCVENSLAHSTEKLHRGILLRFRKLFVSKKLKIRGGRGISRVSIEKLLCHRTEEFRSGIPLCFTKI